MRRLFNPNYDEVQRELGRRLLEQYVSSLPPLPPPPPPSPSGIKLLYNPPAAAVADVVFIHGLTGHRENTWTSPAATDPWPKSLLPERIPNARVLTFGYDSSYENWKCVVSKSRVGNCAHDLLNTLANFREEDDSNERPVIFVCHSLGGVMCENALVSSNKHPEKHLRAIYQSTKGIILLGTPHHGPGLAVWAERFCRSIGEVWLTNLSNIGVLRQESEVLSRIQDSFHTIIQSRNRDGQPSIEITCFYEELPVPSVGLIVPQESAILPGYIPIGIRSNHQDMAKFAGPEEAGFVAICAEIRRWITEVQPSCTLVAGSLRPGSESTDMPELDSTEVKRTVGYFVIPHSQNLDFVGRVDILGQLKQGFSHRSFYETKDRPSLCLYGLGGIGKTQIAVE